MIELGAGAQRCKLTLVACYLFFGVLLASQATSAQAVILEMRQAQATVTVNGQTTQQLVSLPYHWDRNHPGLAGEAVFELPLEFDEIPTVPFGLYLPRLGNAYEVRLNGVLLQRNGDLQNYNGSDFAKAPRYVVIHPGLWRTRNLLLIHIRADVGRRGGLAALHLGPDEESYPLYLHDYRWRSLGSLVVVVVSGLIGGLALALWATQVNVLASNQPRRDSLYLYAGLAELCWTLGVGDALIENPPIGWMVWGIVSVFVIMVWGVCLLLFCITVVDWRRLQTAVWLRRWLMLLLVATVPAVIGALKFGHPLTITLLYATASLTSLIFIPLLIQKALRGTSQVHRLLSAVMVLNALVGLRDLYVFRLSQGYGESAGNTWIRFSSVLFGLTMLYIVVTRFRTVSAQAHDLLTNLTTRVAQKEQELAQSYQRMEQFVREQERGAERTRILRDMHDGVGAHISTAIRQLESGQAMPAEVLQTLRESLDQLKLSIDTMHLAPGDITALLANLRYRLEPRFKTSGIELQWDVDGLAPLACLDDKAMRHLQFMVFEALSNVLQHAHATCLTIEMHATPQGGARLRVIDNGCGFDAEHVKRRGLGSLRERAVAMGATLLIASEPGKTVVEIVLGG